MCGNAPAETRPAMRPTVMVSVETLIQHREPKRPSRPVSPEPERDAA